MADLTLKQAFAKNKEKADNIYAKPDGFYERMGVGRALLAENLVAQLGTLDTDAYQFRTAGGNADIAGIKKVHKIVGRTVKTILVSSLLGKQNIETNLVQTYNRADIFPKNDGSFALNATGPKAISFLENHKYFVYVTYDFKRVSISSCDIDTSSGNAANRANVLGDNYSLHTFTSPVTETVIWLRAMYYPTQSETQPLDYIAKQMFIVDMTKYGLDSLTAQQVYDLLKNDLDKLANGDSVEIITPNQNVAGEHVNLRTTDIIKMRNVGYNAFDGQLEQGTIFTNGSLGPDSKSFRTKNYIRVVPGKRYKLETVSPETSIYDTVRWFCYDISFNPVGTRGGQVTGRQNATIDVPESAAYIKIVWENSTTDIDVPTNPVIAFHLEWSGSRTGYEEYKAHEYPAVFKGYGVNGVGDEYYPDGHIVRKFGKYTFTGNESWNIFDAEFDFFYLSIGTLMPNAKDSGIVIFPDLMSGGVSGTDSRDSIIALSSSTLLRARHTATPTVEQFKEFMSGKTIVYELAIPTTEQGQPYDEEQIVDDYGTEEFVFKSGEMPVPVGHETSYQVNLQNFVQRMYQGLEGDARNVAKADDLEALDNRVEALEGSRLYKHTVRAVSGSETFNLMIVSPISTQLNTVLLLEEAYEAGKIVQCTGTFVNGGTTENVMNATMQNNLFGVSLINATNQTVACRVVAGTVTDTVELL